VGTFRLQTVETAELSQSTTMRESIQALMDLFPAGAPTSFVPTAGSGEPEPHARSAGAGDTRNEMDQNLEPASPEHLHAIRPRAATLLPQPPAPTAAQFSLIGARTPPEVH
jgi:hypothetical protein